MVRRKPEVTASHLNTSPWTSFALSLLFIVGCYVARTRFMVRDPFKKNRLVWTWSLSETQGEWEWVEPNFEQMGLGSTNETTPSLNRNSTNRLQKKRRRAVVRQSRRAGLWERSLATAFERPTGHHRSCQGQHQ